MKQLHLSDKLNLPLETVTQAIGILAKRRAGKSYAARRLTEQLFKAGQQIVIVDPKGDWWGVRSAANGKDPGLPIVILGGERGDVPLEVNAGEVVGKLVVEERVSVLLDLSLLRKHQVATFMADFLESLYRLKAREQYRTPLMLIVDEADAIAPQSTKTHGVKGGDVERMLGAAEDIVRRGGQRGIGSTLITQRSAVLNKNVLTQIQLLVVLRTISPQDLAAIDAWIDVHGTDEERKILKASLPSLPIGDAWLWSPGWPTTDGIFQRGHILPIETFDSGATPKPGEKRVEPKNLADVDLDALSRQMAATIEKAKAEDPKELRKQIAELKKQVAAKVPAPAKPVETIKEVERHAIKDGQLTRLEKIVENITNSITKHAEVGNTLAGVAREITAALAKVSTNGHKPIAQRAAPPVRRAAPERRTQPARQMSEFSGELPIGEEKILAALIQYPNGLERNQLTVLTGYKRSTRDRYLQYLAEKGFVAPAGGKMVATDEGQAALPNAEPLPTGQALQDYWLERLPEGERAILNVLIPAYPDAVDREQISEVTGYKRSTRDRYLQYLANKELVQAGRGEVKASDNLFLD